ncbi:MAG: hypothetical protein IKY61_06065, partial [Thermoguttaceae bacterium]|nr:hypothetical protein [Thermoguttaceae bacterium]
RLDRGTRGGNGPRSPASAGRWSSRRDGKKIRDALPELEKIVAEVGGDDAAAEILGREIYLKGREYTEKWSDSRDWIDLKTEQNSTLTPYAALKIAGTPQDAAAILRRYAADAKKADRPKPRPRSLALEESREKVREILAERDAWKRERAERLWKIQARFSDVLTLQSSPEYAKLSAAEHARVKAEINDLRQQLDALNAESAAQNWQERVWGALFPVDNPESPNRKHFSENTLKNFALRNNAKTTIKMTKKEREDAEKEIRRGLDFVGRVLDNVGVDVQDTRLGYLAIHPEIEAGRSVFRPNTNDIVLRFNPAGKLDVDEIFRKICHESGHALEESETLDLQGLLIDRVFDDLTRDEKGRRFGFESLQTINPHYDESEFFAVIAPDKKTPTPYATKLISKETYSRKNPPPADAKPVSTELLSIWLESAGTDAAFAEDFADFYDAVEKQLLTTVKRKVNK